MKQNARLVRVVRTDVVRALDHKFHYRRLVVYWCQASLKEELEEEREEKVRSCVH